MEEPAKNIEQAVQKTLDAGYRTADISSFGCDKVRTAEMAEKICQNIL
jgi:3-isopropylmalate dehydrogenase